MSVRLAYWQGRTIMLVETDNLVSADEFKKHLDKYVKAAEQGSGPIAVMRDAEVVGIFMSAAEYEAMFGTAVRKLLASRIEESETIAHEEVGGSVREAVRRAGKKS